MFDRVRPRCNHATVVAYLALFVALGGVSYGVATGSIDSREIKDNSVRSKDLRDNGVRAKDIRTGTVRSSDVGNDSLTGADVNESSLGAVPRATTADSAQNADALDGLDSAQFLRTGGVAGGALSGTFPDPGLADGSVTSPKVASDAVDASKVADGSLRLADLAVWTLAGNIGGTMTPANGCQYFNFGTPTGALGSDLISVKSDVGVPAGLALSAVLRPDGGVSGGTCNFTTVAIALPNPFVLRIHGVR